MDQSQKRRDEGLVERCKVHQNVLNWLNWEYSRGTEVYRPDTFPLLFSFTNTGKLGQEKQLNLDQHLLTDEFW